VLPLSAVVHVLIVAPCSAGSSDNVIRLWHARHSTDGSTLLDPAEASAAASEAGITATLPRMAADHAISLETLDRGLAESLMELDGAADTDAQHTAIDQTPGGLTAAAVAAVNASSSRARRPGRGPYSVVTGEADEGLFDLTMPGQHLRGHIGPVTSLCLTDSCLYSGSWDYTVRVWRRGSWDCVRWGT
jgi:WD40 repeat protein